MCEREVENPLAANYYGRRDHRPMPLWPNKICVWILFVLFLPITLLVILPIYLVLAIYMLQTVPLNNHQLKTGKHFGFEAWWRAPGQLLEVRETSDCKTDIFLFDAMVQGHYYHTSQTTSLRKSLECTIQEHLSKGPHGPKIKADNDRARPLYLLHGWTDPYDPHQEELWCTHARTATWAAIYSWIGRMPVGGLSKWIRGPVSRGFLMGIDPRIDLSDTPDVLGFVTLFKISNPAFYGSDDEARMIKVGKRTINAPQHTPETEGKIFARYNYARTFGDFPEGDPDAYIFAGRKVFEDARLEILHEYRILKPASSSAR